VETLLSGERALYLYGIVAHPVELPGCDAIELGTSLDSIAAAGIACVVSSVRADDYCSSSIGPSAAAQLEWVTPRAWRHHEVVRRLHAMTTVIPLKFGTLCSSVEDVRGLLTRFAGTIATLLDRLGGKDEWTLTIRIDIDRVAAGIEGDDRELHALRALENTLPEGRAYFVRKKHQQRAAQLLEAHVAATTDEVHARIAAHVDACCAENKPAHVAALLVDRARFAELAASLAELEAEHASSGLSLELRGPWAPYGFVNGRVDCRELTPATGIESRPLVR
jgi:gas vesicle protein GvpL/GvpF